VKPWMAITPTRDLPQVSTLPTGETLGLNRLVRALAVRVGWRDIVEPITELKSRLDHVLNGQGWKAGSVTDADRIWLKEQGFLCDEEPYGTGVVPERFSRWIVGHFQGELDSGKSLASTLTRIPPWCAVGWNRYRQGNGFGRRGPAASRNRR